MLTVFPKVVTSLFNTRSRLQNRTGRIAVLQSLQAVVLVGGTALLAGPVGLTAVGWSALAAEGIPALLLGPSVVRWLRSGRAATVTVTSTLLWRCSNVMSDTIQFDDRRPVPHSNRQSPRRARRTITRRSAPDPDGASTTQPGPRTGCEGDRRGARRPAPDRPRRAGRHRRRHCSATASACASRRLSRRAGGADRLPGRVHRDTPAVARTVGVEEEYLLVDPDTGRPRAVAHVALAAEHGAELTGELQREQLESATRPCTTLAEVDRELRRARAAAARAAAAAGAAVGGARHVPAGRRADAVVERALPGDGAAVRADRVRGADLRLPRARRVDSEEEGVGALDRIRPWLAPLLALTANSPFWQGADSGYASYRSQVWQRWPSAGPYAPFGSPDTYHDTVQTMIDTDTVLDRGMVYFDARLSAQHPTLEIRVADVCLDVDDAVLLAALARALVETAVRAWRAGTPADPVRLELLRLAAWRAARSGVDGMLLDPCSWRPAPATDVLGRLVTHLTPALDDAGDLAEVRERLAEVLRRGTGARAQAARGGGPAGRGGAGRAPHDA